MTTTTAPPVSGPLPWARRHLFNTWYNGLLSLALGAGFAWAGVALVRGLLGADLTILRVNLTTFMVGRFPRDQVWRPAVAVVLVAVLVGITAGSAWATARDRSIEAGLPPSHSSWLSIGRRFWPLGLVVVAVLALTGTITPTFVAIAALVLGIVSHYLGRALPHSIRRWTWLITLVLLITVYLVLAGFGGVGWDDWGGLQLNLFLTVAGILFAFPLGLLLALGRRSSMPAIRTMSVTYIELVRGVPLITLLLFGAFAIGFLLPENLRPSTVTRMLLAITIFESAYIAEVVRGGLQAVPPGQVEASQALGMTPTRTMRLIVLPQALRATIPAMVGQFISLYKDTTLVAVIGVLELLEVAFVVNSQPDFLGQELIGVTLSFAALIFWAGSYTMSREARRLERKLGVGER